MLGIALTTGGGLLAPPGAGRSRRHHFRPRRLTASATNRCGRSLHKTRRTRWLRDGADAWRPPWHAGPETTALFAQDYMGFAEIDRTTTVTEHVDEAWVGVGYALPSGESTTAATIHLA